MSQLPASQIPAGWTRLDLTGLTENGADFLTHIGPLYQRVDAAGLRQLAFEVQPHMCNLLGICHGGMLMSVMDAALGIALLRGETEVRAIPTISLNFDFLAPGQLGDWLEIEAEVMQRTRRTGFVTGRCVSARGPIVTASGMFKIST